MTSYPPGRGPNSLLEFWKSLDLRQLGQHWLSALCACFNTVFAVYVIWHPNQFDQDATLRLLATISLGISLFLLPGLVLEEQKQSKLRLISTAFLVLTLAAYAVLGSRWSNVVFLYKTLQGFAICHLLVSLATFFQKRDQVEREFWSANWFLLNRFQMAATQCIFLLIGISLALLSIQKLFGIQVASEVYATTWVILLFFVSVMLFIGSLGERREVVEPPEILKRIVRTVLTPLALAYFAILYAYAIKIGLSREWPRGGIGLLVSGLALIVTLSYVIMRPLATSNVFGRKLKSFWNWSFRLLLGPVLMLMLGLGRRVSEYGWTEQRAALGYLSLWMFGIGIYYWHPNRRRLVGIPLSLLGVLTVTWFGPLSPSYIGEKSQTYRLIELSTRKSLTFEDKKNINSILRTICEAEGPDVMAKAANVTLKPTSPGAPGEASSDSRLGYGATDFARLCGDDNRKSPAAPGPISQALAQLGIPKLDRYSTEEIVEDFYFNRPRQEELIFQKAELGIFTFDDWQRVRDEKIEKILEQLHGGVKMRMKQKPATLEWEAAPGVWRKLDLGAAIDFMKNADDKETQADQYARGLRLTDSYLGRRLEVQITSARLVRGDVNQLGSIHFTTLLEHAR